MKNNFLFFGPEGCGKTLFANALFSEMKNVAPEKMHVEVKVSGVLRNPEEGIKRVFEAIDRFSVTGLLIENVDELFVFLRSYPSAWRYLADRVRDKKSELLVIGTTRRPEKLTAEEVEVFNIFMPFLYPSETDRLDILKHQERDLGLENSVSLENIVQCTHLWTSEELIYLLSSAAKSEYRKFNLSETKLWEAYDTLSENINLEARAERLQELLAFAYQHTTPNGIRSEILTRIENIKQLKEQKSTHTRDNSSLHIESMVIINTTGGAYISGDVNPGGDFIGRDKLDQN